MLVLAIVLLVVLLGGGTAAALALTHSKNATNSLGPSASVAPTSVPSPTPTATATPTPTPTPSPTPQGVSYTDPQGYYTAAFDGAPGYHTTTQSSPAGNVPYMYAEFAGPDVDQLVGVLVFRPGTTFDPAKGLQGIADSAKGTVVSSQPSSFEGYPSVEGVIAFAGEYLKLQVVHVGSLAYIIGTAGPVNPPSDYQRFLATVHITPH